LATEDRRDDRVRRNEGDGADTQPDQSREREPGPQVISLEVVALNEGIPDGLMTELRRRNEAG
jgi:hypothetical protein